MVLVACASLLVLVSWGSGISAALLGLFIYTMLFLGLSASIAAPITLLVVLLVPVVMARIVAGLLQPIFFNAAPPSARTLLSVLFTLACLMDNQFIPLFGALSSGIEKVSFFAFAGILSEAIYVSSLMSAVILLAVALLESPFHWLFSKSNISAVDWLAALRPILLVVLVMGCFSELSQVVIESTSNRHSRLLMEQTK